MNDIPDNIPRDTIDGVEYLRLPPIGAFWSRADIAGSQYCEGCEFHDDGISDCEGPLAWLRQDPKRDRASRADGIHDYNHDVFVLPENYRKYIALVVAARMDV